MEVSNPDRLGDWMQTFTGRQFWPLDPRVADLSIDDIDHALSNSCRYAGHCLRPYSVAEHSVHLTRWLSAHGWPTDVQLAALMHDAPEAYVVDVPRPLKPHLINYQGIEDRVWQVIAEWLSLPHQLPTIVHEVDKRILHDEMQQNMAAPIVPWDIPGEPLGITIECWSAAKAKSEFLQEFERLMGGII